MKNRAVVPAIAAAFVISALAGCDPTEPISTSPDATLPAGEAELHRGGSHELSVRRCAPSRGGFTIDSDHRFFPMRVGRQWVYEGEEDGESVALQITILDRTRTIAGVTTRVIEEREWVDGELLEVSWNYFARARDGTVCYFGEDVDIYEDEGISHEGAWCASTPGFAPGIFLPARPRPGMRFRMEVAPGVAEDEGRIVGSGPVTVPYGRFRTTIRVREHNPLDGDTGFKVFAARTGMIVDGPVELVDVDQTEGESAAPSPTDQACGV